MSFLSGILGVSVSEKKRSMIRVIFITAVIVIVISLILMAALIADRASKNEDPDDKDSTVNEITQTFEFGDTKTGTLLLINKNTDEFDFTINSESKLVNLSENIAKADGENLNVVNLYIGGCSLESITTTCSQTKRRTSCNITE